ncbi:uncharacterized protein LOC127134230 [Lathyrus oleraceus]|uniref:Mitochondrial import inner membrane translocase subunit TIM50 n=1 Tax=Pisum sativum TaxID=3888 RepID=A0A9D5GXZ4_PEA|nr:uncharacterized protein LOC127134230 [Pisum sativum]KAI5445350.1 hypothetical protein KIW84_013544 [Pisum sativum]
MDLDSDLHESPASPDLSGSQSNVDVKLTEKKKTKKRKKGKSKNNSSQSCVEADICLHGNEEKKQKVLSQAAEKGNGESEIQDKADNCNSVVVDADAKLLAKESVLEVVKMDIEQSINENSSNPKETSDSVKNGSPVNNHDEDLKVHDLSNKSQSIKTYSRKKLNDVNCKRNLECPSAENSNKEPIIQDHNNDGSHEVSDGPLRDVLMEGEKEHLTNQNKVEAEEMELIADYSSEKSSMTTSSIVDIPVTQHEERNARQKGHAELTRNGLCCLTDISDLSLSSGNSEISQCSVDRTIISNSKNKLLILDVNGLLADCVSDVPNGYYQPEPDFWVRRRKVYKRPFCDDFIQFCFERFHVGVWSSRTKSNVDDVIELLLGKSASRLLFCWNQSHCTTTKFNTVENRDKPLVLKELRKLWEKLEPGLPWEKGEFHESNTLLLDDSPYKALVNPKHTAIFPYSYRHHHIRDSALGPKGDLRGYLERLSKADNVQEFVSANPFGQRPIREANISWGYYLKVIESVKCSENDRLSAPDKEETPAPDKEETPTPVKEETSAPIKEEETSAPVKEEETSAPVKEETSALVKEETSAPVKEETA